VPLAPGADAAAITGALSGNTLKALGRGAAVATVREAVVAAAPGALDRVRAAAAPARPGLADALAVGADAAVQVVVIPSSTQRRALEESVITLPPQLGGRPVATLTQGLRWASIALSTEPRTTLHAVFRAKDQAAARAVQRFLVTARDLAADSLRKDPMLSELARALSGMQPSVSGDDVTLDADPEKTTALVMVPIREARESARRSQCGNNLKQIALAMHNYHSAHNSFPPAYNASKDGKPLLSWRVHLLPFLDRKGLYDRFHLDEPWDSPHNRPLVAEMPAVYACPGGNRALAREGKTTYLTPRGPVTMFPGAEPIAVKDVPDGTSNTIMAVDAGDARAVVWTMPEDWEIGGEPTTDGLFGHHSRGTNFAFGDGAVRFLKESIAPNLLKALLTRNGGEVISAEAL
jgi:prepilin-type processing-associated H-X9-DG protein